MRYAITSKGKSLAARVDKHFGRCRYIVIYDSETGGWEFVPNPFKQLDEGAGPLLVKLLNDKGIYKVVSGSFGIKIKGMMDSKHMQMIIPGNDDITVSSIINFIENKKS